MPFSAYTTKTNDEVLLALKSSTSGLSQKQAELISKRHPNTIGREKVTWFTIFARQWKSPFIYLLLGASLLALLLGEHIDSGLILFFILLNVALSFYQEYKSNRVLQLLKQYTVLRSRVRREGQEKIISSELLVPGDIVILQTGDIVPADVRVLESKSLQVDESILTGESLPVEKTGGGSGSRNRLPHQAHNILFAGTSIVGGHAEGVVVATGKDSFLGDITKLTAETTKVSSFEKSIARYSKFTMLITFVTLLFIFIINILFKPDGVDIPTLIIFAIALAVSVVPEALPVVITFALTQGVSRLSRRKVIVKRLSALEDMGEIEVLCTDKTGTLTENKLSVIDINARDKDKTLFIAALGGTVIDKDTKQPSNAFDIAMWNKLSAGERKEILHYERLAEIPFDPARKRSSALFKHGNKNLLVVRGAIESVLPHCENMPLSYRKQLANWAVAQGELGRRVIVVASNDATAPESYTQKSEESKLKFLGLVSFVDPIKPTTKATVREAQKLGIQVKLLTGDSKEVGGAVGVEVGLIATPDQVMTGDEFDELTPKEQKAAVHDFQIFARVTPQQKYKIIELLQEKHVVGFLGEGINDAPALKLANVALVVDGASDIARDAADIILLQSSLKVIIEGIKEGRKTFVNTTKYIKTTLASNFGNFYALALASLFIDFLPMLPIQILLLNLLSDFPMIAISADNVDDDEIRVPRSYNIRGILLVATLLGLVSSIYDFGFFAMFQHHPESQLQTVLFMASVLTELVFLISARTKRFFLWGKRPANSVMIITALATFIAIILPYTLVGQQVFHLIPLAGEVLATIIAIVAIYFVTTESAKLLYYRIAGRTD